MRPATPEEILAPAWALCLRIANRAALARGDKDVIKRVNRAASSACDVVRSVSGVWLDAETLFARKVSPDRTLKEMPWSRSKTMIDAAANTGPLAGFVPLQPLNASEVVGPFVLPRSGAIFVRRAPEDGEPGEVDLARPAPDVVDAAWDAVCSELPGLHRGYLSAVLYARFTTQRAVGTPAIIAVTGLAGSAKTATANLAGGMVGARTTIVALDTADDTLRRIGLALEEGAGILLVDEVGRLENVYIKLEPILRANSDAVFRAKYANERVVRITAPFVLSGSTLPLAVVRSPELARRAVGYRLTGAEKVWRLQNPETGVIEDLKDVRRIAKLRLHLDSITASIWWKVHDDIEARRDWRTIMFEEFGAVALRELDMVDGAGAGRDEVIRSLYDRFRTAADAELSQGKRWIGWLVCNSGTVEGDALDELIERDVEKKTFLAESSDLERMNLAPILGFERPQLQILVRRRSGVTLAKFVEVGTAKGKGTPRQKLPPMQKKEVRL